MPLRLRSAVNISILALFLALAPPTAAQSFQGLELLPINQADVEVSPDGTVVITTIRGEDGYQYAVRWVDGEVESLFPTGDFEPPFYAGGVSADGSVVVGQALYTPSFIYRHAFRWWEGGTMEALGTLLPEEFTGGYSRANAVSADGNVLVGGSTSHLPSQWATPYTVSEAFRWEGGTMVGLGFLDRPDLDKSGWSSGAFDVSADGSIIVGESNGEAFRWENGAMVGLGFLPGGDLSTANGIAADGTVIVGGAGVPVGENTGTTKAFRWTEDEGMQQLGYAPDVYPSYAEAFDVSADGSVVVGTARDSPSGDRVAFIWTEAVGMQSLQDVLENEYDLDLEGWQLIEATSVSNDGTAIVGIGMNPEGEREVWGVNVPIGDPLAVNVTTDDADTDLSDDVCDSDASLSGKQCSLRAAIEVANARTGRDSISFAIEGPGPHTIVLSGALPALTEPLVLDATTQEGYTGTPLVELSGTAEVGLSLGVGQTTVRGLAIGGFNAAGIRISGAGENVVEACHLGLDAAGTTATPNGIGLLIEESPDNVIGGDESAKRNVISGNTGAGVVLTGASATGNVVAGNYVGTSASGSFPMGNGAAGVRIDDAPSNTLGGIEEGARNLIAANGHDSGEEDGRPGVLVMGAGASGNVIAGNYVGTDASGTVALGNAGSGVKVDAAPGTHIGGTTEEERNVIAGNATHGVFVQGAEATGVQVAGNYIGVGADGTAVLPNGTDDTFRTGHHGVFVASAPGVIIGGAGGTAGAAPGNVIAGNAAHGIYVRGRLTGDGPADEVQILGNYVGVDATGGTLAANGSTAILVDGAVRDATIGQAEAGNVVTNGDLQAGIGIFDLGEADGAPDNAQVAGNTLGFDAAGSAVLGEMQLGIVVGTEVEGGGPVVAIGGEDDEAGNRVRAQIGVLIEGEGSEGSVVASNVVGLKANGQLAQAERDVYGIVILAADRTQIINNTVGGQLFGIVLGSNENEMYSNRIGTNPAGTAKRPNTIGLYVPGELEGGRSVGDRNMIGAPEQGNVISGNKGPGISMGNDFQLVSSGDKTAESEKRALAKALVSTAAAQVGAALGGGLPRHADHTGADAAATQARTASARAGEAAESDAAASMDTNQAPDENVIAYNRIGTTASGASPLGNGRATTAEEARAGVFISDGTGNQLLGNVISDNGAGVQISIDPTFAFDGQPEGTMLAGNIFGGTQSNELPLPNQYGGAFILGSPGNVFTTIEEGGTPIGNTFWGDGGFGGVDIRLLDSGDAGNKVRQADFFAFGAPSINLRDAAQEYPAEAPDPPRVFSAVAGESFTRLWYNAGTTGAVDAYMADRCDGGHAGGVFVKAAEATGGPQVLDLDYAALPATGPATVLNYYLAVTVTEPGPNGMTSAFSDCIRVAREEDVAEAPVDKGADGPVLDGPGIEVEATPPEASLVSAKRGLASGTLYAARYRLAPDGNTFEGSAITAGGAPIEPDSLINDRYWRLGADGLDALTYTACLDATDLPPDRPVSNLVVLHRPGIGASWTPHDSFTQEASGSLRLCTSGLTSFGELALGFNNAGEALPVELATFTATLDGEAVLLKWQTTSETNNAGFEIERRNGHDNTWRMIAFVEGGGTINHPRDYHLTDAALPFEAQTLIYRLRQIDFDGAFEYSPEVEVTLAAPERFALEPNYPNPFRGRTTFRYAVSQAGPVRLALYDVLGREVAVLVDEVRPAGRHEVVFDAIRLSSGLYLARLTGLGQVQTRRLTVVK